MHKRIISFARGKRGGIENHSRLGVGSDTDGEFTGEGSCRVTYRIKGGGGGVGCCATFTVLLLTQIIIQKEYEYDSPNKISIRICMYAGRGLRLCGMYHPKLPLFIFTSPHLRSTHAFIQRYTVWYIIVTCKSINQIKSRFWTFLPVSHATKHNVCIVKH